LSKRILVVGDSPALQTGFGKVNRKAVEILLSAGHDVAYVAGQEFREQNLPQIPGTTARYIPRAKDYMGFGSVQDAIEDHQSDLVYVTADAGTFTAFTQVIPARVGFLGYIPIEGEPIVEYQWRQSLSSLDWFTCSQYGVDVTKRSLNKDIDFAYHGIDPDFQPDAERREATRKLLGWEDKFVIICVAQNVRRKQWPRLIEAVSILKHHYKQKDIVLYAHTVPFDNYWLEGWNLPVTTNAFGVYDEVVFNPKLDQHNAAVDLSKIEDLPGLVDMYNAADVFVLPSQV
jgi:glycosyltransferase involved in cell wall biosynthesis